MDDKNLCILKLGSYEECRNKQEDVFDSLPQQEGGSTMEVSSSDEQVKMKANEQPNRIKKA